MTKPKLKPCPFCGGKVIMQASVSFFPRKFGFPYILCTNCIMRTDIFYTQTAAIKAWNRRYNEKNA